jgi:hypothetical protein
MAPQLVAEQLEAVQVLGTQLHENVSPMQVLLIFLQVQNKTKLCCQQ